jgi:hypothetical protein
MLSPAQACPRSGKGVESARKAVEAVDRTSDPNYRTEAWLALGNALRMNGDYDAAIETLPKGEDGQPVAKPEVQSDNGSSFLAREFFGRAHSYCTGSGTQGHIIQVLNCLCLSLV